MERVRAVATAHDLNLVAIEFSLAKNANALIVKRLPSPELVSGTQDRQSIFGFEVSAHCAVENERCSRAGTRQSGRRMILWSVKTLAARFLWPAGSYCHLNFTHQITEPVRETRTVAETVLYTDRLKWSVNLRYGDAVGFRAVV